MNRQVLTMPLQGEATSTNTERLLRAELCRRACLGLPQSILTNGRMAMLVSQCRSLSLAWAVGDLARCADLVRGLDVLIGPAPSGEQGSEKGA